MTSLLVHAALGVLTVAIFFQANAHLYRRDWPGSGASGLERLYYALLLSQAGQSSRALELFAGLRERFADRFELWWEAGTSLARLGHFVEAREALGQALALVDPQGTGQGATVAELRAEIVAVERAMARREGAR